MNVCVKNIVNLAACICAQDGVISSKEETTMFKSINLFLKENEQKQMTKEQFDNLLNDFFEQSFQLEDYTKPFTDSKEISAVLNISRLSASSDGMEIRENIALRKVLILFELDIEEFLNE